MGFTMGFTIDIGKGCTIVTNFKEFYYRNTLRGVTIAQMGNGGYRVRVTSRTGSARRILGILKKSVS